MTRKNLLLEQIGQDLKTTYPDEYPGVAQANTNVVLVDRLLLKLLKTEVEKLASNQDRTESYFAHFFHGSIGKEETDKLISYLQSREVKVVLGYPRTAAQMPCLAIVLEAEQEVQTVLSDALGSTTTEEGDVDTADYRGSFFECTYGIWIYAEHPDVCSYLYQIVKMLLVGSRLEITESGFLDLSISGTELVPNPELLPENMFVRTVRVSGKTVVSVPYWTRDPAKLSTRVFSADVVVDGLRGGVSGYDPNSGDD